MIGYKGIYNGIPVYMTYKKDYKPMEDTYIVLLDTNDIILNGYIVAYWQEGQENEIVSIPNPIEFPFLPNEKKIVQETQEVFNDNKNEMKTVYTTLYQIEEEQEEEENKWGDLEEKEEDLSGGKELI